MLFGQKYKYIDRPLAGQLIPLDQVSDPGFAQKMMGEGFGVAPEEDIVRAPIAGTLVRTKMAHAFMLTGDADEEILVHIGIDTVNLKGEGFSFLVEADQHVEAGQPIVKFDRESLAQQGYDTSVIVAFSNFEDYKLDTTFLNQGNHVFRYRLK
ncbi:MAG: PTS glucose transporter subunit IIA [Faecalibacterium sp.]|jgi:PTS system beta-glucosides-specific IIC component|nr:PTS glucose transporter subunit IIA [Faecalibacterium sp.]